MSYKSLYVVILSIFLVACYETSKSSSATLNKTHPFVISGCDISYKAKPLKLGAGIESWVEVLGPYDRKVNLANDVYVWDQIGLNVLSFPGRERAEEMAIIFNIERGDADRGLYLPGKENLMHSLQKTLEARPTSLYEEAFLLDGVPFDKSFNLSQINKERHQMDGDYPLFQTTFLRYRFRYERQCNGHPYGFGVHTMSDDLSQVRLFYIGSSAFK